ncbi:flavodoxin reductase family protein [Candidatus Nitrososphaera evergladensis SR1]|jgi:ferredoxin-NADP reductase/nitrite reductase/ring-hydroxylating ferredoxin subunit|uniref:Flavodoxin reductase family protein n=1 Tax=Candidatus Nitrososphaera evergladensis SR1 TaxID=1459636 RepID=A0A075MRX2_9ARCH|nr:Rieske 2Fe-2S domain-containing protein [Candidatus Nitrososphaera evergladensis]AIF84256.1 flavodoxin reductase family protein [Candidatus Nitrososphaera evergladensis SR1]
MPRYTTALRKGDLQEGKPVRVDVGGKAIVLVMVSGKVYAMDAVCSHEGGPLEDGTIEEYSLICPWHQGIFDIRTAKASPETDWVTDLHSYGVVIEDKSGLISIDTNPSASNSPSSVGGGGGASHGIAPQETAVAEEDVVVPARPLKFELKLLEKVSHAGTDVMSFRFSRTDDQDKTSNNKLNYRAGQYSVVDLGTREDPEGPTRSFTIASSPTEKDAIMITTRIRDTPFKQKLSKLEEGTAVKITAPAGKFTLPEEDYSRPLVFLSGGIGVTPFRSMIKYASDKQLPIKITMFDANRNKANIIFKEEFDSCAKANAKLKIIYTISEEEAKIPSSDWNGERGYIDKTMLTKYLTKDELANSIFYICGPPAMLNAMRQLLSEEIRVPQDRIKIEVFTGY